MHLIYVITLPQIANFNFAPICTGGRCTYMCQRSRSILDFFLNIFGFLSEIFPFCTGSGCTYMCQRCRSMSGSPTAMNCNWVGNLTKKKNVGLLSNSLEEGFLKRTLFQFVPALVVHISVSVAGICQAAY